MRSMPHLYHIIDVPGHGPRKVYFHYDKPGITQILHISYYTRVKKTNHWGRTYEEEVSHDYFYPRNRYYYSPKLPQFLQPILPKAKRAYLIHYLAEHLYHHHDIKYNKLGITSAMEYQEYMQHMDQQLTQQIQQGLENSPSRELVFLAAIWNTDTVPHMRKLLAMFWIVTEFDHETDLPRTPFIIRRKDVAQKLEELWQKYFPYHQKLLQVSWQNPTKDILREEIEVEVKRKDIAAMPRKIYVLLPQEMFQQATNQLQQFMQELQQQPQEDNGIYKQQTKEKLPIAAENPQNGLQDGHLLGNSHSMGGTKDSINPGTQSSSQMKMQPYQISRNSYHEYTLKHQIQNDLAQHAEEFMPEELLDQIKHHLHRLLKLDAPQLKKFVGRVEYDPETVKELLQTKRQNKQQKRHSFDSLKQLKKIKQKPKKSGQNNKAIFASLAGRYNVSPKDVRRVKKLFEKLAMQSKHETQIGPRKDYKKVATKIAGYLRLPNIDDHRIEQGRPTIMVLVDVSGSMSAIADVVTTFGKTLAETGIRGADIVVVLNANGYPHEIQLNKNEPQSISYMSHAETVAWYKQLIDMLDVQIVISAADGDGYDIYREIAEHPRVKKFIWLDPYLCSSYTATKGNFQKTYNAIDWSKKALKKLTWIFGCRDVADFIAGLEIALKKKN